MIALCERKKAGRLTDASRFFQKRMKSADLNRLRLWRLVNYLVTPTLFVWNRLPPGCCLFGYQYPGTLAS
jgi:hypothetical protein